MRNKFEVVALALANGVTSGEQARSDSSLGNNFKMREEEKLIMNMKIKILVQLENPPASQVVMS